MLKTNDDKFMADLIAGKIDQPNKPSQVPTLPPIGNRPADTTVNALKKD